MSEAEIKVAMEDGNYEMAWRMDFDDERKAPARVRMAEWLTMVLLVVN